MTDAFFDKPHTAELSFYTGMEWLYILVLFMIFYEGLYTRRYDFWEELKSIYKALFFSALGVLAFVSVVKISDDVSRFVLFAIFLILSITLPLARSVLKHLLFRLGIWKTPVSIITEGKQSEELKKLVENNPFLGYVVVDNAPLVIVATKDLGYKAQEVIKNELASRKEIIITPFFSGVGLLSANIHYIFSGNVYFINLHNNLLLFKNRVIKRVFDIFLLLLVLPVFLCIFLFVFVAIKLDSKGSVFFRQKRVGEGGVEFECIKFRTMHKDGGRILDEYFRLHPKEERYYHIYRKLKFDPRVTRVGRYLRKYSLDELPQVFNVLKGEMSFIGPRPYMGEEVDVSDERMANIIKVRPGLTGLWQVSGRNALTFEDRLDIESWYIRNWSLWIDFVIFLKTFGAILKTEKTA